MSVDAAAQPDIETLFKDLLEYLNSDHDAREEIKTVVRELEQTARGLITKLQAMHSVSTEPVSDLATRNAALCATVRASLEKDVREQYVRISEKIPQGQYYRCVSLRECGRSSQRMCLYHDNVSFEFWSVL